MKSFLFLATPMHIDTADDIRLFVAKNENECLSTLAEIESVNYIFRKHIEEKAINDGFVSLFFDNDDTTNNQAYEKMVHFFGEHTEHLNAYVTYLNSNEQPNFSSDFYHFVALKLIKSGEWCSYDIKKVAEIDGIKEFKILH
ncbi:hypothetical protein [Alkalihalophilus marmarensis]|uniref:Uncharacterized protein n=1 Tax=Alkalihalophilus marmarensis DSM 21297 TaxID=1188261 RepID=U6STT9_9BACI|nr:hypothetical protein [Alkalihalophilus marmarensis]ERN54310.1 hypothetical protein A33I_07740 [Alkalihalophilus marmarensis DSM 21297]